MVLTAADATRPGLVGRSERNATRVGSGKFGPAASLYIV